MAKNIKDNIGFILDKFNNIKSKSSLLAQVKIIKEYYKYEIELEKIKNERIKFCTKSIIFMIIIASMIYFLGK